VLGASGSSRRPRCDPESDADESEEKRDGDGVRSANRGWHINVGLSPIADLVTSIVAWTIREQIENYQIDDYQI
jgi:hypothetical protein